MNEEEYREVAWTNIAKIADTNDQDICDKVYGDWADTYERDSNAIKFVAPEELAKRSVKFFRNDESSQLLDVAAGTGTLGQHLRTYGFTGIMDAIDISAPMLAKAKEKGIYRNIVCQGLHPEESLPFEDDSYDVVALSGGLGDKHIEARCILVKPEFLSLFHGGSLSHCLGFAGGHDTHPTDTTEVKLICSENSGFIERLQISAELVKVVNKATQAEVEVATQNSTQQLIRLVKPGGVFAFNVQNRALFDGCRAEIKQILDGMVARKEVNYETMEATHYGTLTKMTGDVVPGLIFIVTKL